MTEQNIQDQSFDLSDEHLADVTAGSFKDFNDWVKKNIKPVLDPIFPFLDES